MSEATNRKKPAGKVGPGYMRCTVGIRLVHWCVFQGIPDFTPDVHTPGSRSVGQHVSQASLSLPLYLLRVASKSCANNNT